MRMRSTQHNWLAYGLGAVEMTAELTSELSAATAQQLRCSAQASKAFHPAAYLRSFSRFRRTATKQDYDTFTAIPRFASRARPRKPASIEEFCLVVCVLGTFALKSVCGWKGRARRNSDDSENREER